MRRLWSWLFFLGCCALSAAAHAEIIVESELPGVPSNNSLGTAQVTGQFPGPGLGSLNIQGQGGGFDVDFYSFQGFGGSSYFFDIDGAAFDPNMALFDSAGRLIAHSFNSAPPDDGSLSSNDPFIGLITLPSDGLYYLAIAADDTFFGPNVPTELFANLALTFTQLIRPDGVADGGLAIGGANPDASFLLGADESGSSAYSIAITSTPEPGTLVGFGICGAVAAIYARRKRPRTS
jgi:hypothetical protein